MKNNEMYFTQLYTEYVDEIYSFLYTRTGLKEEAAKDITQEVFTAVFTGLGTFRKMSSERTWIYGITRNKLNDYYRNYYRNCHTDSLEEDNVAELADPEQDLSQILEQKIVRQEVELCMRVIHEKYRMILILKYLDGKSIKEIAGIMDKTAKAAEGMLLRARAAFIKEYIRLEERQGQL